jgi:hypothetical protein
MGAPAKVMCALLLVASGVFLPARFSRAAGCTGDDQCGTGNLCFKPLGGGATEVIASLAVGSAASIGVCAPAPSAPVTVCASQSVCEATGRKCFQPLNGSAIFHASIGTAAAIGYCVGVAVTPEAQKAAPVTVQLLKPKLEIPIPFVDFTGVTIAALAAYLTGVYKYLLSVVGVVAAVMIIIGGFQYLTAGGDKGRADKSRKRIENALVGLLLAFGSFAVLYAINPSLVQLKSLGIFEIEPEFTFADRLLSSTTAPTGDFGDTGGGTYDIGTGSYTRKYTTCPLTLPIGRYNAVIAGNICAKTQKDKEPKRCKSDADCPDDVCAGNVAFYKQIRESGLVTGTTPRERVLQVADITDACNVNLGSCGDTAGAITALAGIGKTSCLNNGGQCGDDGHGKQLFGLKGKHHFYLFGWNCGINWEREYKEYIQYKRDDCKKTQKEALAEVRRYLLEQEAAGNLDKGWPDVWANKLKAGDRIHVYNGNNDLTGSHAAIVVGWTTDGNSVQVVQGGGGGSGAENDRSRGGTLCIKRACEDKMLPLVKGWSAGP